MVLAKRFLQTASVIAIQHEFQVTYKCRKAPSMSAINRLLNKFEKTGSVIKNKNGIASKRSIRTPHNSPKKCVIGLSQQLNLEATPVCMISGTM
jgi:hypothetical protein